MSKDFGPSFATLTCAMRSLFGKTSKGTLLVVVLLFLLWAGAEAQEGEVSWWYEQARFAFEQGDLQGALLIIKEARKRFPGRFTEKFRLLEAEVYYEEGKFREVLRILEPMSLSYELPPRALVILAEAYLRTGNYGKALFYANLVKKRSKDVVLACKAELVLAETFVENKLSARALTKAKEILKLPCDERIKARALSVLLRAGYPLEKLIPLFERNPALKVYAPDYFKALAEEQLKKGQLEKATENFFLYLNLSGKEEEAPSVFLRLAEAFYKKDFLKRARVLYELILTAWPHYEEAKFAKFRVYYMNYLFRKKLGLPRQKERTLLLPVIKELKEKYPQNPVTEEAHLVEIELLLEEKRPKDAFFSAVEFTERYPRSRFLKEVYRLFCEADSLYLQKLFTARDYFTILELNRKYGALAEKAGCGPHFYWLGKVFQTYHLLTPVTYYMVKAYEFGVSASQKLDLLLILSQRALEERKEFSEALLKKLEREFPHYRDTPVFLLLKAEYLLGLKNWIEAKKLLKKVLEDRKSPEKLKRKAVRLLLKIAESTKNVDLAFELIKGNEDLKLRSEEFASLIHTAIENGDYLKAKEVLEFAEKLYPKEASLKWLKGLLLERMGREEEALEVWKELAKTGGVEGRLAQAILKSIELVDKARRVIY